MPAANQRPLPKAVRQSFVFISNPVRGSFIDGTRGPSRVMERLQGPFASLKYVLERSLKGIDP